MRNIELFNMAVEYFRQNGHRWPTSKTHTTMLTGLKNIQTEQAFEQWILRTSKEYDRVTHEVIGAS